VYEEQGYVFPVGVLAEDDATGYADQFLEYWRSIDPELRRRPRREQAFVYEQTHLVLPWVLELVRHPVILDAVAEIIGNDIVLWISQWFVKLPGEAGVANGLIDWH
jgi:hypothetical protein